LQHHERQAFLKFFFMYFASVAVLVLLAGFFYFQQIRSHLLKAEEFSILEYARHIKMGGPAGEFGRDFSYRFLPAGERHIDIRNFHRDRDRFVKLVPIRFGDRYLEVRKSAREYDRRIRRLILRILSVQALLLLLFGLLSWRLAKSAIRPLEESIDLLDTFIKDLIHDLNTPLTAIKLNLTVLGELEPKLRESRVLQRLQESARTVSELHENLTILLEEKTFQTERLNLCPLIREVVEIQRPLHPGIRFELECDRFMAILHPGAFRQILQNLLSNAGRYNRPGGYVRIHHRGSTLLIEDSGKGIEDPQKVFEREYSGEGSSGLGLDIVKRLAMAMQIGIDIRRNKTGGTTVLLTLP
jgi:two-component system OmpR family sensor kinase